MKTQLHMHDKFQATTKELKTEFTNDQKLTKTLKVINPTNKATLIVALFICSPMYKNIGDTSGLIDGCDVLSLIRV